MIKKSTIDAQQTAILKKNSKYIIVALKKFSNCISENFIITLIHNAT